MPIPDCELRQSAARARFSELADVLLACAGVELGRQFGRQCLKFGKRAFIVHDVHVLAFLTGPRSDALLRRLPAAQAWNPRNGRTPKQSWLACPPHDPDCLGELTIAAYEWVRQRDQALAIAPCPDSAARTV